MSLLKALTTLTLVGSAATTLIADPTIYGNARYQFSNSNTMVTFGCGGINNPSRENATGTIQVKLWALDQPYTGGNISGKVLGEYKLEGLNPGSYYSPVSKTLRANLPSVRKHYHICLTVLEHTSSGYVITDYRSFSNPSLLGPVDLFSLAGPWRWSFSTEGGTLDFGVAKISHTRSGSTGSLKLSVWATEEPFRPGISGYQLGAVIKAPLKPGYSYNSIKQTAKFKAPPPGTYHITLVLSEFAGRGYGVVDSMPASNLFTFN